MDIKIIENMVKTDLIHVIADEQAAHPGVAGDALVEAVLADLKHFVRGRIGFITDMIWTASVQNALRTVIRDAISVTAAIDLTGDGSTS